MGTVNMQTSVLTAFLFLSTLFTYAFERTTSKRLNPNDKYTPKFGQITTDTLDWINTNIHTIDPLLYSEEEIASYRQGQKSIKTARLIYDSMKVFWTKLDSSTTCSWQLRRWQRLTLKSMCGSCCTTEFFAIAPITVEYNGKIYYVYHPTLGWQILFIGGCPDGESCLTGTCTADDNYHTWILVMDDDLVYEPKIRFVPISYPRFCKCVNSS